LGGAPTDVGAYTVVASFTGSIDYLPAESTVAFSILPAAPALTVSDPSAPYTGSPFAATATVTGVSGTPAPSLEGVSPTLLYYAGSTPTGTASATAPTATGTYTVVAAFAGSTDYASAQSSPATFTIAKATPSVSVAVKSGPYTGLAFTATATVTGVSGSPASSLEGVSPTLTYYTGSQAAGKGSPVAPTQIGTYTVAASFAGSADYMPAESSPVTFSITKALPTLKVTDAGGTYTGSAFGAKVTVAGSTSGSASSLEGVKPTLLYYAGSTVSGRGTSSAPTKAGTYTVVALFKGSTHYAATQSAPLTFTIKKATPTVTVADAGGKYDGKPFPAKAKVKGVTGSPASSLEGVGLTLAYYNAGGTLLSGAPSAIGTYTVVASFAGSADYAAAQSKALTFVIT
jgi:hypothetical protein